MIKYLGSKRVLVPVLGAMATAIGARSAVDLFSGTTRVAQEFKRRGLWTTASDRATYTGVLAECYIATEARQIDRARLTEILRDLQSTTPVRGYVTRTFCEQARYFQPKNGMRIDAIRQRIEDEYVGTAWYPILLTSLLEAADRVDSTTGIQMAYLKSWAPRSRRDLSLRTPDLLDGPGAVVVGDVMQTVDTLPEADLYYVDPPYNQHRYFANYHVWETLVRWDEPEHYGVACKRVDVREDDHRSVFNSKRTMPAALADVLARIRSEVVIVSYSDEAWITPEQMEGSLREAGHESVAVLGFDSKRYVGASIGIHSPTGEKVGRISHLRNTEHLFIAGPAAKVEAASAAVATASPPASPSAASSRTLSRPLPAPRQER
ncbi:DNA adenine methylase [Citricoccus sp. GCM10030269]|uniref:DNA adenine methylase n=1 Tax=Citricoccus sp. GCM10030269 TaxID=3273388 RepID=UPI0036073014